MRRWLRACSSAAAAAFLAPLPAFANVNLDTPVATAIFAQSDSPVRIESCGAVANDYQNNTVDPPAYAYTEVEVDVAFRNTSDRTVAAAKFGLIPFDPFDKALTSGSEGTVSGNYSPGVLIEPHRAGLANVLQPDASAWTLDVYEQDVSKVVCLVESVRYADGSVWNANLTAELAYNKEHPAPTPSPDPYAGHPQRLMCRGIPFSWDQAMRSSRCRSALDDWRAAHDGSPTPAPPR
jgi:hypothetical protein